MRRENPLLLWVLFPVLAAWRESGRPERRPFLGVGLDTLIRLAVWMTLAWSLVGSEWSAVLGSSVAIIGLGLIGIGFRWYADRRGWRQRWLQG